jgi:hypothetical protein
MAANPTLTREASRGRDDPVVTGLVTRAGNGERQAWDALVERYAPLIWSICRRHRLEAADADGAAQNVWLKLPGIGTHIPLDRPLRDAIRHRGTEWPVLPPGSNRHDHHSAGGRRKPGRLRDVR